jgi:UPF0755 protein
MALGAVIMLALLGAVVFALRTADRIVFGSDSGGGASTTTSQAAGETKTLLIPEGYDIRDIEHAIAKVGISPAAYQAALKQASVPANFLVGGEKAATLEGFLFPATYQIALPASADDLVQQQLQAFVQRFGTLDLKYARQKHLTAYDVLKIASMVEREAVYPPDRAKIAAVIYNRLHAGMPIGIDASIEYAVGQWRPLTAADLRIDSPYNTRTNHGLPPTPISNPGLASLKAAAHPAHVKYLYYYAIPHDPRHRQFFTTSYQKFLQYQRDHPE